MNIIDEYLMELGAVGIKSTILRRKRVFKLFFKKTGFGSLIYECERIHE